WYIDAFYRATFVRLAQGLAGIFFGTENQVLDRASDGLGSGTLKLSSGAQRVQHGRLPVYVGVVVIGLSAAVLFIGWGLAS
ncbi:MAG: hypothetical protein KDB61_03615, partial [Planctomycetes bacterium]|nr:hypothetical protein [Planctomycetota bacterium]